MHAKYDVKLIVLQNVPDFSFAFAFGKLAVAPVRLQVSTPGGKHPRVVIYEKNLDPGVFIH